MILLTGGLSHPTTYTGDLNLLFLISTPTKQKKIKKIPEDCSPGTYFLPYLSDLYILLHFPIRHNQLVQDLMETHA